MGTLEFIVIRPVSLSDNSIHAVDRHEFIGTAENGLVQGSVNILAAAGAFAVAECHQNTNAAV